MSFLRPAFAAFCVLFAVPLVIHLIGKQRAKVLRFGPIEMLRRAERRVAQRTRIRHFLLLSLRAAAIAAVPLILSKPFFETDSKLPAQVMGSQSAVIVIDDSLSMSLTHDGHPLLSEARTRARQIVRNFGRGAEAAVILGSRGGGTPIVDLTADRARLDRAIAQVGPTYHATDLTAAMRRAAQILETATRSDRRIYLVSDLAAHGFASDLPWSPGAGPEIVPVDVTDGSTLGNRAITDLKVEPASHLGPRGVRITVEVANFSDLAAKEVPVTLHADGVAVAKGFVDVPPRQKTLKRFFHSFAAASQTTAGAATAAAESETGAHDVSVELEPDALPGDDRRHARVEIGRNLRVLLVDGDPRTVRRDDELFYLEAALRPGEDGAQLEFTTITPDELERQALSHFDVIFLCNVKSPSAAPLRDFVTHGGGLFISLGDNVDADVYDQTLGELLPQPLQTIRAVDSVRVGDDTRHLEGGERLERFEHRHPVLEPFNTPESEETLKAARFARYALFRPVPPNPAAADERQTLMSLENGAPLLIEKKVRDGRVMIFASTLDRDWNDLAIQPAFLPLMRQVVRYLAHAPMEDSQSAISVGDRHEIPLSKGDQRVEVTMPSGKQHSFDRDHVMGRERLSFGATDEPGLYRVSVAGSDGVVRARPALSFAVNVEPTESDPTRLSADKLAALAQTKGTSAKSAETPRRKVELWHALGAALLLLLLGEALLLRRK